MLRLRPLAFVISLSLLGQWGTAAPASAQPSPSAEDREGARALGYAGLSAFDSKRWAEAYEKFRAANELVHSPVFELYMARAKLQLGDLLAATALLKALTESAGAPDEEPAWQRARDDAKQELEAVERRIPRLVVTLTGAQPARYSLEVDGVSVALGAERRLNPGKHTVKLQVGDQRVVESVELVQAEGTRQLTLSLKPAPKPPRQDRAKAPAAPQGKTGADAASQGVPTWLSLSIMGLGAVSLGVSGVSWLAANAAADDAKAGCVDNRCPSDNEAFKDDALGYASVSTWTLVGGAAAVIGGGALWLFAGPSDGARVGVGPQRLLVSTTF